MAAVGASSCPCTNVSRSARAVSEGAQGGLRVPETGSSRAPGPLPSRGGAGVEAARAPRSWHTHGLVPRCVGERFRYTPPPAGFLFVRQASWHQAAELCAGPASGRCRDSGCLASAARRPLRLLCCSLAGPGHGECTWSPAPAFCPGCRLCGVVVSAGRRPGQHWGPGVGAEPGRHGESRNTLPSGARGQVGAPTCSPVCVCVQG